MGHWTVRYGSGKAGGHGSSSKAGFIQVGQIDMACLVGRYDSGRTGGHSSSS